jgi:glycine/D-amino acid oxidase-like deaminating enzyme/bacterioferritin-associated ferredoxin
LKHKESPLHFTFDGETIEAMPGESIASALVAAGKRVGRHTQNGNPRDIFCGMGVCFDCLVIVKDLGAVRSCMTKVSPGMEVMGWPESGLPDADSLAPLAVLPAGDLNRKRCQLAVIGAGPGGLAAAKAAAESGIGVVLFDERSMPGGQFYKQMIPSLHGSADHPLDRQYTEGLQLIKDVQAAGCRILSGALVWRGSYDQDGNLELSVLHEGSALYYYPEQLIIATGAYDEPLPLPGWTLPGVMTAGAAQTFVRSYGVVPEGPVVVAGNGPLILQAAYELSRSGAEIAALISSAAISFDKLPDLVGMMLNNPKISLQGMCYLWELKRRRIPMITGHVVTRITGKTRAEAVVYAPVDFKGNVKKSAEKRIEARTICQCYGLLPASELPRQLGCRFEPASAGTGDLVAVRGKDGQSSLPSVYIVGEAGGIGGAYMAIYQGRLAGWSVAEKLGKTVPVKFRHESLQEFDRHRNFESHLSKALSGPALGLKLADDDTYICRCEEVTLAKIKEAIARGVTDMGTLKRLTRAGMGLCQGRYCGPYLARLLAEERGSPLTEKEYNMPQPPLKPIPLLVIAVEKTDRARHERSSLRPTPQGDRMDRKLGETDALIIGAGVAGCSTAFWLAKEGKHAIIIDRGPANGQASGANAGSIHVQLLLSDFRTKSGSSGNFALRTLVLQKESATLWHALEEDLGKDFEFKTVGGLMVAENERDVKLLEDKAAAERSIGIDVKVIDATELRRIAPAVSRRMVAAAYCPEEGKMNPLIATQSLLEGALTAGQMIHTGVEVIAVEPLISGFKVHTRNGWYRCGTVVNAAGAWASQISAMVGDPIPVHGRILQMIVTEPVAPVLKHLLTHAGHHLSMKQANNGNFIIGGGWSAGWNMVCNFPTTLRDSLEGSTWVARRTVPCLDSVYIIRSWAGTQPVIDDGAPIVGAMPGVPGFYNTVTPKGYTLGPIMGRITSDLICRGKTEWDISFCGLERFTTKEI